MHGEIVIYDLFNAHQMPFEAGEMPYSDAHTFENSPKLLGFHSYSSARAFPLEPTRTLEAGLLNATM